MDYSKLDHALIKIGNSITYPSYYLWPEIGTLYCKMSKLLGDVICDYHNYYDKLTGNERRELINFERLLRAIDQDIRNLEQFAESRIAYFDKEQPEVNLKANKSNNLRLKYNKLKNLIKNKYGRQNK